ncbi:MAG TPA: hypothetical protein VM431_02305 [Phycisphaerae bacterium]|nr:hypothetical protein [Phycisphaerae bacterium]
MNRLAWESPWLVGLALLAVAGGAVLAAKPRPRPPATLGTTNAGAVSASVPLPALVREPASSRASRLTASIVKSWLPPADVRREPLPLAAARQQAVPVRPDADVPALADASPSGVPARPLLPAGSLAWAESPDAGRMRGLPSEGLPNPDAIDPAGDRTLDRSWRAVLVPVSGSRRDPAPVLRLVIPDPFELEAAVRMAQPPPDTDAPVFVPDTPARPTLPVKP